jgi:ferredoxin
VKVRVERDKCVSAGQCVLLAPEVFDQDEADGVVVLLQQEPSEQMHAPVREAAHVCPASAIRIQSALSRIRIS